LRNFKNQKDDLLGFVTVVSACVWVNSKNK